MPPINFDRREPEPNDRGGRVGKALKINWRTTMDTVISFGKSRPALSKSKLS